MTIDLASRFGSENGTRYRISAVVREAFPDCAIVEISDGFDLERFANRGHAELTIRSSPSPQIDTGWRRLHGLAKGLTVGVVDVRWEGASFVAVRCEWPESYRSASCWVVVGEAQEATDAFVSRVCGFSNFPGDTVLVFQGGCWGRDPDMYAAIQASSFDDLILAGTMAADIQRDFASFVAAKDAYARYGVPWKRGVLFLGPPGNGKTHTLRATVKLLGVPCLFVRSLESRYGTDDGNIAAVFERAREMTPCCLVLEDLDAMLNDRNRSFFLNEIDGFADASGLLTLASTNHPERLDPALLHRPSRFDRKYTFALPAESDRARYIASWRTRTNAELAISDDEVAFLAGATAGFSFAYLKELLLSSMLVWMSERERGMFSVLQIQVTLLREQMTPPAVRSLVNSP